MQPSLSLSSKSVRPSDLKSLSQVSGSRFRLVAPTLSDDDPVLQGDFRQVQLRPGFFLHCADTHELYDLRTEAVQRPGLTISLFLKGEATAWFGGRKFHMGPSAAKETGALEAIAISKARPEQFSRHSVRGTHIRKVNVSVTPEWLEASGLDATSEHAAVLDFSRSHLASTRWRPSPRFVSLAEQILRPPAFAPMLQNLYCESRAVEIVGEALQVIAKADTPAVDASLRPRDYQRVSAVTEFLEAHLDEALTLEAIARHAGVSVNTLQRTFRLVHDTTVFDYVRARKMQRAREVLERDGVSVAQAAYAAGYTSAANFATAFRRFFGISPKNFRARL
jgi:AraC-like DNA-binding protein